MNIWFLGGRQGARWTGLGRRVGLACVAWLALLAWAVPGLARAQAVADRAAALPPELRQALTRSGLPLEAVTLAVRRVEGSEPARLRLNADQPYNPASVMKLVTTYAALDLLGPDFTWRTGFWVDGPVQDGLLRGNLYIRGGGDPKWVMERITATLQAVRAQGVAVVHGDIVLDQGAFDLPPTDPGGFDGERLRPYNASPQALLVNFKSVILRFVPDAAAGVARVQHEPPLAGVRVDASVSLAPGPCSDWRGRLQGRFEQAEAIRFVGAYPARCGELEWPVAYQDPDSFATRAVEGLWRAGGGLLTGRVRSGPVAAGARLLHEDVSLPLSDIVSDINKFSNNLMAQQVFLTLGRLPLADAVPVRPGAAVLPPALVGAARFDRSRERLARWWVQRLGPQVPAPMLDNGSGLSRDERITADGLLALLRDAARHPQGKALLASLPVVGVDGTAARMGQRGTLQRALGQARVKTGSLRDVVAIAGYVPALNGEWLAVVGVVNHPHAQAARPVLDALMEWAATQER